MVVDLTTMKATEIVKSDKMPDNLKLVPPFLVDREYISFVYLAFLEASGTLYVWGDTGLEEETKKASQSRNCAAKKVKTATKVKDIACSLSNNGIVVANGKHMFAVIMS